MSAVFAQVQQADVVVVVRARPLLGTLVEIRAAGTSVEAVQLAISEAFAVVTRVHDLMSYQLPDSDISLLNRVGFDQVVQVDAHTWQVLSVARRLSEASAGLFDITVASLLSKMGFLSVHPDFPRIYGRTDWRHVELLADNRIRFSRRLRIDVSGIAKGYAVDQAIQVLRLAGMDSGQVNAGGDLRVFGSEVQTIHVRHPIIPAQMLPLVELTQGAAATSAGYYNQRIYRGRRVAPLIDPRTRTAAGVERSVTVLADNCMVADALTKVVSADPVLATAVLAQFNARALILEVDPTSGACHIYDTAGMASKNWYAIGLQS